jgi:hypothetical protein
MFPEASPVQVLPEVHPVDPVQHMSFLEFMARFETHFDICLYDPGNRDVIDVGLATLDQLRRTTTHSIPEPG